MKFSQKLKILMDNYNLSNARLKEELGCSFTTIANWLNGKSRPRTKDMEDLAAFFSVDCTSLSSDSEELKYLDKSAPNLDKPEYKRTHFVLSTDKIIKQIENTTGKLVSNTTIMMMIFEALKQEYQIKLISEALQYKALQEDEENIGKKGARPNGTDGISG